MLNKPNINQSKDFITPTELAGVLGVSRITIHKRITKGEIPAQRVGRFYLIPKSFLGGTASAHVEPAQKEFIRQAVKRTVKEYGETLRLLGQE